MLFPLPDLPRRSDDVSAFGQPCLITGLLQPQLQGSTVRALLPPFLFGGLQGRFYRIA
jgi:hypothetical protein